MVNSKLYSVVVCETLQENLNKIRKKYYSKNIFNRWFYGKILRKVEKDYDKCILKLEEMVKDEYNI